MKFGENLKTVKIIFIIVNWNGREKIGRCLRSLATHLHSFNYKILVVDNGSTDGSSEFIKEQFPEVILLINKQNLGYARACNQAMEYLRERSVSCDYLVFLNNDVELRDNSLEKLFSWMEENKEVAACLPAVLDSKGKPQSGAGGFDLSLASAFCHFFFLAGLFPRTFRGLYFNQSFFYKKKEQIELDWLSGVALVVRSPAIDVAGPMPEYFFMYTEDLAYGRELRKAGKLIYFPLARVYHLQEREKGYFQVTWLDSLFTWYKLLQGQKNIRPLFFYQPEAFPEIQTFLPARLRLELLVLQLIFASGFILRWIGYAFRAALSPHDEPRLKKKEMMVYFRHIARLILKSFKFKTRKNIDRRNNIEKNEQEIAEKSQTKLCQK